MALKKEELITGCFAKAHDDEPLFVLCSTDSLAPDVVRHWIALAQAAGAEPEKIKGAKSLLYDMVEWQATYGAKIPD